MTDIDDGEVMVGTVAVVRSGRDDVADDELGVFPALGGIPSGIDERAVRGLALLVVKSGPNVGAGFVLDQPVSSVGRHPDSNIFLDDITVSRRHSEFRSINGKFQVADVGSLNGTYVDREPVDTRLLANGDEIQIGKFRLVFLLRPAH